MSATVDSRVVEMRFDNKQFESNVSTTMSTLEKLKQKLNLTGATKGLEDVSAAAKGFNLSGMSNAADAVVVKFSHMQMSIQHQLDNLVDYAFSTGKRMISALTIDPIKTGLSEYETQINAVQTILANTESKGTTLDQVNGALDTLNTYADKTIYNFTEMTRNIGTFTAAGVDLDTSVNAIQGIANLAAVSGSNSQQASTAMYQLSQALSSGTVKLMDWNSVVNAGMGGQVFQDALKETARVHGVAVDDMIKKHGSFRETLSEGWITADILTETLSHFTMAAEEGSEQWNEYKKSLMDTGYSEEQANAILKLSNTATDAATKVKTATQLWDTLKETAQSGWTQTWEILLGDFGEAKELFSGMYEMLSPLIEASSEARNTLLEGAMTSNWDKMIGKINEAGVETSKFEESLRSTVESHGIDVNKLIEDHGSLAEAFKSGAVSSDILREAVGKLEKGFGDLQAIERNLTLGATGEDVKKIQETLQDLGYDLGNAGADGDFGRATEAAVRAFQEANGLEITGIVDENTIAAIEKTTGGVEGLSDSVDDLMSDITKLGGRENIIKGLINVFDGLLNIAKPIKDAFTDIFPPLTSDQVLGFTENFKALTERFKEFGTKYADQIKRTFKGVFSILDIGKKIITAFGNSITNLLKSSGMASLGDSIMNGLASIGDFFTGLNEKFDVSSVTDIFTKVFSGVTTVFTGIYKGVSTAIGGAIDLFSDFGGALSKIGTFISDVATSIWEAITTVTGFVTENVSMDDVFAGLAGGGIFMVAKKLSGLIDQLKELFDGGIMNAIFGKGDDGPGLKEKITELFDGVGEALNSFTQSIKIGSFLTIAVAVAVLSSAFSKLAELNGVEIGQSLIAIAVSLGIILAAIKLMPKNSVSLSTSIALIAIAAACSIMGNAMQKFSGLSWDEIGRGLVAMGGALIELVAAVAVLGKVGGFGAILGGAAILIVVQGLGTLADALKKFGGMAWDEIGRGLVAMGGALLAIGAVTGAMGYFAGLGSILAAGAILIVIAGLGTLADALKKFGGMAWDEIGRGLAAMAGALLAIGAVTGAMGYFAGLGSILAAGAILMVIAGLDTLASGLQKFGSMTWDEIGRGLTAMGVALLEIALLTGVLGTIAGLSGLLAAGAILIVISGLDDLASALQKFGSMSWAEIGKGLVAMGVALLEIGAITAAMGYFAGLGSLLAAGAVLIVISGLDTLADGLKKFGSMSWDEIAKGLVAMGVALLEIGSMTAALGTIAGLSGIIAAGTILLVISGLDDLAAALQKFGSMSWEEIAKGLTAMGIALLEIGSMSAALGTIAGLAGVIGAGTILLVVQGLGDLADALKKFGSMSWDEIGRGLTAMGAALGEIALGGLANTLSGIGGGVIADVAEPLGVLADSVMKWNDVSLEDGLGAKLASLAGGILSFTLGGLGASVIADVATPLGDLADSVTKWTDVKVPDDIGTSLEALGSGVKSFNWSGLGAGALSDAAPGIGDMADSVKKWNGVTVPDGIGDGLSELAGGVKSFIFSESGGDALGVAAPGVGTMAESIEKWVGVTVPEGLGTALSDLAIGVNAFGYSEGGASTLSDAAPGVGTMAESVEKWVGLTVPDGIGTALSDLASGVKDFNWGGSGADAITSCATSIGTMADSLKKWIGLTLPENIVTNLQDLAEGVIAFNGVYGGATSIDAAATGIGNMADSVAKWSGVTIPEGFSDALNDLAAGIAKLCEVETDNDVSSLYSALYGIAGELSKLANINYTNISTGMSGVTTAITDLSGKKDSISGMGDALSAELSKPLKDVAKDFKSVGTDIVAKISEGVDSSADSLKTSASTMCSNIVNTIAEYNDGLSDAGKTLGEKLASGIENKKSNATDAGKSLGDNAKSGARDKYDSMETAGTYLGSGFIAGIGSQAEAAYNAGYALGAAAARGVEDGEDANSPSKLGIRAGKWLGQGFVIGIDSMGSAVYKAGFGMGDSAVNSISKSVRSISSLVESGIDSQPTIRPIVDLSDVKAGANAIGGMLGFDSSVGVLANVSGISTMMNRRGQNGGNEDVISAINKLGRELGSVGNTTYSINGVTYDDGTNVATAVKEIVRAARTERRV